MLARSSTHYFQVYAVVLTTSAIASTDSPAILARIIPFLYNLARETMVSHCDELLLYGTLINP